MTARFADSFYYFALLAPGDEYHDAAVSRTDMSLGTIVTTPWVLTEVADGLASPINRPLFLELMEILGTDPNVILVPAEERLFRDGIELYADRPDKEWSLTDCISFVVMRNMGIHEALTGDHHFEQAGFVALLMR